jgi:hypothetical protein
MCEDNIDGSYRNRMEWYGFVWFSIRASGGLF